MHEKQNHSIMQVSEQELIRVKLTFRKDVQICLLETG